MVTREQIEAEAAWVQDLIKRQTNPTGTKHSPLPWKADKDDTGRIASDSGTFVGYFRRPEDRDLALYFTNVHAGMIGLIKQMADSFEFIGRATDDPSLRSIAADRAETARIYAALFARLGKPEGETAGETCDDSGAG